MFKTFNEYLESKGVTPEAFNQKTEKEQLELHKQYADELRSSFATAIEGRAAKADIDSIQTRLDSAVKAEDFDAVKSLVQDLEAKVQAFQEEPKKTENKIFANFFEAAKAAIDGRDEELAKAATTRQEKPFVMEIKAAVTIGLDNTVEAVGSASQVSVTRNSGIISAIRKRVTRYLNSGVSVGSLAGDNKVMWIEELDEQGNPIFIGEGDTKTQLSVRYEERDAKARKIAVYGKVTTEMMRNLPSLIMYIQNNLLRRVDIATENGLFSGDGTGDNLNGLSTYATAFDGGGLTTAAPTFADVFRALALQVEKAHGVATKVFVRPEILAEMDVEKTTDGHYLMPPFRSPLTGNTVAGIQLESTTAINGITDVDFIGGDLSVVQVMFSDNISVQIGMDGNDFTQNKKTILVEQELVQFVSANDTQVLVKGNMATALATITAS